ncbi:GntR family transcriptional regulator [Paenibacillus aurantius]|uniref:GntR family transcriptional regulator n=1 Tax=Paenibacillus aurantius TaxID=2918900 RepID=A0AA96LGF7_9BACL|nr:GntR family transcriptional regulator [Paenibacillus aurantius]WJH32374.1 GntR family transcriptional regulator [Paenibacillus sp. CC-CFT747]WNQ12769.1 GntR family transcriptional regulator [Paenibacillus aurantius]
MIIRLDLQSELPIYTQLVHQIIEGIADGRLAPGEPLPSVRSLAADIGINLHTVNKAYSILKAEGFIQVHRQKGVVVQPGPMPGLTEEFRSRLKDQLRPLAAEAVSRGMEEEEFFRLVRETFGALTRNKGEG